MVWDCFLRGTKRRLGNGTPRSSAFSAANPAAPLTRHDEVIRGITLNSKIFAPQKQVALGHGVDSVFCNGHDT